MLRNRYNQFRENFEKDYSKEADWQRELQESVSEERQRRKKEAEKNKNRSKEDVKKIMENAKAGKLDKIKNLKKGEVNIKPLVKPWTLAKYIRKGDNGIYFVIFMLSVIFDLISIVSGGVSGAVSWVPVVNSLVEGANVGLVFLANAVIVTLYVLAGHYKKTLAGRQFMKVVAQFGFSFLELLPGIAILPGFIGAFLVNYWLVLYSRAVEDLGN